MKKLLMRMFLTSMLLALGFFQVSTADGMIIHRPVYRSPGRVIQVSLHAPSFVIALPENPTTGYRWNVPQYDAKLLTLAETHYMPSPSQLVGAGGFKKWTFDVNPALLDSNTPFETTITLTYARPWAAQDNPKTLVFTVMYFKKPEGANQK